MRRVARWSCVFVLFLAASANAATFVVYPDRELVRRSDAIVVGAALTSYAQVAAYGGIETVTSFSIEEVIKGSIDSARIAVHEPGGVLQNHTRIVPGAPQFAAGERVLLFLKKTPQGTWSTTDLVLGKFSFETDRVGQKLLVRQESDVVGYSPDLSRHYENRRNATKFLDFVRAEARGAMGVQDYTVDYHPLRPRADALRQSRNVASTSPKSYTFSSAPEMSDATTHANSNGFRWTTFPSAVTFYHFNTGGNTTIASNAMNSAMGLWNGDCASNVNLVNGGADPGPGTPSGIVAADFDGDQRNDVVWETNLVPYGASAFVCGAGGTVGIGGVTVATSGAAGPGGETFFTIIEGDVDMAQNVLGCASFTSSVNFVNAVAHEIGHSLGFRHSDQMRNSATPCVGSAAHECSTTAIMKAVLVNGLSGLPEYDMNAVRSVYPAPCGATRSDFTGDGKSDIILRSGTTGEIAQYQMNGTTLVAGLIVGNPGTDYSIKTIGDYNGDGKADLAMQNAVSNDIAIWLLNGASLLSGVLVGNPGAGWQAVGSADFNADGKSDIVLQNQTTGDVAAWLMNGGSITGGAVLGSPTTAYTVVGTGDFNSDSKADVLLQNFSTGDMAVWQLNGLVISGGAVIGGGGVNYRVKAVGDANNDGKADIFLRHQATGDIAEWQMNGFILAAGILLGTPGSNFDLVGAADYNGNSKADLLLRDTTNGNIAEWLLDGGTITGGAIVATPGPTFEPVLR
jgi:hypothetical protein